MVLQLWAGREQKAWQSFGDWHLVLEPPSFFCSSLFAHFHPSIPSLFNWLFVKVLLSASTCPCHSKQRQPGDTALSVLSSVCTFFPPAFFSYFLLSLLDFFPCLVCPSHPLAFLPFSISLPLSFSLRPLFLCFCLILHHIFSCFFFSSFFLALWQTHIITVFSHLLYCSFWSQVH